MPCVEDRTLHLAMVECLGETKVLESGKKILKWVFMWQSKNKVKNKQTKPPNQPDKNPLQLFCVIGQIRTFWDHEDLMQKLFCMLSHIRPAYLSISTCVFLIVLHDFCKKYLLLATNDQTSANLLWSHHRFHSQIKLMSGFLKMAILHLCRPDLK